jgi:serine phosphatase RsbU (regulator of sigma subunit)
MRTTYAGGDLGTGGLQVWWQLEPADGSLGGDWFDFVRLPEGRVALVIGDAAGHDGQAAALAGVLRAVMRVALLDGLEPDEVFGRALDEVAVLGDMGEMYATGFIAVADLSTGSLTYANAGHPAAVILPGRHAEGQQARELQATGPVLSDLFAGSRLWSNRQTALAVDDRLLVYTDGVTETRTADGRPFGTRPFFAPRHRTVSAGQLIEALLAEVRNHQPGRPADDRSMAVLARVASPTSPFFLGAGGRPAWPRCPSQWLAEPAARPLVGGRAGLSSPA